jgi:hypothetical protein
MIDKGGIIVQIIIDGNSIKNYINKKLVLYSSQIEIN